MQSQCLPTPADEIHTLDGYTYRVFVEAVLGGFQAHLVWISAPSGRELPAIETLHTPAFHNARAAHRSTLTGIGICSCMAGAITASPNSPSSNVLSLEDDVPGFQLLGCACPAICALRCPTSPSCTYSGCR